jgi:hypothetical protein
MKPVITRITATHAVADKNSRVASELARLKEMPCRVHPLAQTRRPDRGFQTRSWQNKRPIPAPDQ